MEAHHIETEFLGYTVHADTLYFAWACMALILACSLFLLSGLNSDPSKYGIRQYIAESIYGFIRGLAKDQIGKRADSYVFLLGSLFIFIFVSYCAGLFPWKIGQIFNWWPGEHGHLWHGASPCADLNVTAGMALIVIITYFFTGVFIGGWDYFQLFLPLNFSKKGISLNLMCLIEIMDLMVRPLTLSLRLFANTVAGEVLVATFVGLVALLIPVLALGFEVFVGVLQAFIFTILSAVYIGAAVKHAEEHLEHAH
jgi:F-type H+-transporting ATPase subunit a